MVQIKGTVEHGSFRKQLSAPAAAVVMVVLAPFLAAAFQHLSKTNHARKWLHVPAKIKSKSKQSPNVKKITKEHSRDSVSAQHVNYCNGFSVRASAVEVKR